jgi:hypothetical protein
MGNMRETVHEAFEAVKESATEAVTAVKHFDAQDLLERHPWLYIGGIVALGYGAYRLLEHTKLAAGRPSAEPTAEPHHGNGKHHEEEQPSVAPAAEPADRAADRSEDWRELIAELKALAIGVPLCILRDKLSSAGAEAFRSQVNDLMNALTGKLGGRVIQERGEVAS